jgi:hypothetical protein
MELHHLAALTQAHNMKHLFRCVALGVPFGAHREYQVEKYAPLTPASSTVGMLGAASRRLFAMNA